MVPAGELSYYEADEKKPWEYLWIRFHGPLATSLLEKAGITPDCPIHTPSRDSEKIENLITHILRNYQREYDAIGSLFCLFQEMIDSSQHKTSEKKRPRNDYTQMTMNYIQLKYTEPISIQEIADYCSLDRSYLTRIFKNEKGISPQEYLRQFRIEKAKALLLRREYSIQSIAYSVGYNDPFAFSKAFRQLTGCSPTDFLKDEHHHLS